jgi:hypothetical protein
MDTPREKTRNTTRSSNAELISKFENAITEYYESDIECHLHDYLGVTLEDMIVYDKTGKVPDCFRG